MCCFLLINILIGHYFPLLDPFSTFLCLLCANVGRGGVGKWPPWTASLSGFLLGSANGIHQLEVRGQAERGIRLFLSSFQVPPCLSPLSLETAMFSTAVATTGHSFCKGLVFTGLQMYGFLLCALSPGSGNSFLLWLVFGCLSFLCFLNSDPTSVNRLFIKVCLCYLE